MKYAIIDISSSSISLLVAEGEKTFDVLLRERENISILHYMEGKNLSERGVERLAENLEKMKEICRKTGVVKCYVISTASMRNFENFEWVAEELKKRAGVNVNLLDGEREAYCDLVSNERYKTLDRAFLVDIGGGSIEICDLTRDGPDALTYLDFGPIQLNGKFVKNIHPDEKEAKEIKKYVKKTLKKTSLPDKGRFATAVLVGATNRAVYDVYLEYCDETEPAGEQLIEYDKLKKLCRHLVRSSDRSMLVLKNAPEKIYTLTTAAVILRAILKHFGVANIVVSDFGVKEGYLALAAGGEAEGELSPLDEIVAPAPAVYAEEKKKGKKSEAASDEKGKNGRKSAALPKEKNGRKSAAFTEEKKNKKSPTQGEEKIKTDKKAVAEEKKSNKKSAASAEKKTVEKEE